MSVTLVYTLLVNLSTTKATGMDKISAKILQVAAPVIAPSLTEIFNMSIDSDQFPSDWKAARIIPLFKKGQRSMLDNYRPISILPVVSKLMEIIMYDQMYEYLNQNNLFSKHQFGFRPYHSTTTTLLDCTNEWYTNMDRGLYNLVVFLDLKKASDSLFRVDITICHDVERNPGPTSEALVKNCRASNYVQPCITDTIKSLRSINSQASLCDLRHRANVRIDYHSTTDNVRLMGLLMSYCVGEGRKLPLSSAPRPIQSYISNKRRPTLHTRSRNAANLVNICCDPYVKDVDTNTTLSVCLVNTRSIRNKIAEFADYVSETKLDLYAVTETWLMVNDDSIRAQLCPTGYKLLDKPREGHRGGGTALFYKDSFTVSMVNCRRVESFEYLEVLVSLSSSSNLRVVIVYRRPYSDEHKVSFDVFINEFSNYLESVVLSKENLLIIGDFNIHMDVPSDTKTNRFLDLLESLGLQQHVDKPTHIHGHILDLVITRKARTIINTPPVIDTFFSDHASIVCKIQTRKPAPKAKVVTFRKFKSIDMDSFHDDLASSDLCTTKYDVRSNPTELEKLVENYEATLSSLVNQHAPIYTRRVRMRQQVPWYNKEIAEAKRERRRAERRWRKSKLTSDFQDFKKKKNTLIFIMNKARKKFYANFIDENSCDQKKLFRETKNLLAPKYDLSFPDYCDKQVLVDDMGEFFCRKVNNICNSASVISVENGHNVPEDRRVNEDECLCEFQHLSCDDVRSLFHNSSKKTCSLDPMPTFMVLACLEELLPAVTCVLNSSLSLGHFPTSWKEAIVDPRLKKSGIDSSFPNLRPVSNLQFLSKLVERAVFNQTNEHMLKFQLYPLLQSAFRTGHSTETALLKVQNDILLNMDQQKVTLLVMLDLSAAFDTVNHQVLLNRLEHSFGITGTALQWFRSYLANRSQRICFDGYYSKKLDLPHGVPQGSCLGPLLFTIYASKLFDIIKAHLPDVHAYADDSQLYLSFRPDPVTNQVDAVNAMQNCIESIRIWMAVDQLKLNDASL